MQCCHVPRQCCHVPLDPKHAMLPCVAIGCHRLTCSKEIICKPSVTRSDMPASGILDKDEWKHGSAAMPHFHSLFLGFSSATPLRCPRFVDAASRVTDSLGSSVEPRRDLGGEFILTAHVDPPLFPFQCQTLQRKLHRLRSTLEFTRPSRPLWQARPSLRIRSSFI